MPELPPTHSSAAPPELPPSEPDPPRGLIGLLVRGVEQVLALMGRLLFGIVGSIFGNLTGGGSSKEPPSEDEG